MKVAIIGGTGLGDLQGVDWFESYQPDTPFGQPSAQVKLGRVEESEFGLYFLPRHGGDHSIAPHKINYRANIAALKSLGITHIFAVNAVGGLSESMGPQAIVVPDQIIDYTAGRETSFFDGVAGPLDHVDFTEPYDTHARDALLSAAKALKISCVDGGVYGATQGPRLETAAEVRRCQRDGCDLVGMTGMPEAVLARELGIAYASLCLVVNWGAGMTKAPITLDDIHRVVREGMGDVQSILLQALSQLGCADVAD